MDSAKMLEIRNAAFQAAVDAVKKQVAAGSPKKGLDKARHVAVMAYVVDEMLGSFGFDEKGTQLESNELKAVFRAAFSGSLLNASQLRQEMEKAGVLEKTEAIASQYDV